MAIDYTELFSDVGKNVKATNEFHDLARSLAPSSPDFDAILLEIQTRYEGQGLQRLIQSLEPSFNSFRDSSSSWASNMSDDAQLRLLDRDTVVNELAGEDTGDIDRTIREIFRDMVLQSDTLNESAVVISAPTFVGVGNGTLATTIVLDGVTPPSPGFGAFLLYDGTNSQLSVPSELMSLTCIADEDTAGTPEGHEIFLWEGQPVTNGTFGWKTEGSGISVQLSTAQAAETLVNRDFESWDGANTPNNWAIETGIAGTEVIQETAAVDVHRGTSALKLVGNGFDIRLVQELPSEAGSFLAPSQQMYYAVYVKAAGVTDGKLTIRMESPSGGYTASASEEIVLDTTALGGIAAYTLQSFFLPLPASLPEDLRWVVRYEADVGAGPDGEVWIDSMGLAPLVYANGIGLAISAGATSFVQGDRFSLQVDNTEGIFSQFFRRRFLFQLPADGVGAETIPDTLAQ